MAISSDNVRMSITVPVTEYESMSSFGRPARVAASRVCNFEGVTRSLVMYEGVCERLVGSLVRSAIRANDWGEVNFLLMLALDSGIASSSTSVKVGELLLSELDRVPDAAVLYRHWCEDRFCESFL